MSPAMDYSHLAQLYDTYASFTIDVPFYLNEARQQGGQILELMSGTGRVSLPLIESGFPLTCVDSSPQMLQMLRDKLAAKQLTASVLEMDVRELDLGRAFDLVFIPFNSFSELVSTRRSDEDIVRDQTASLTPREIYLHPAQPGYPPQTGGWAAAPVEQQPLA
jgi:SAM-dependent methyltransferase